MHCWSGLMSTQLQQSPVAGPVCRIQRCPLERGSRPRRLRLFLFSCGLLSTVSRWSSRHLPRYVESGVRRNQMRGTAPRVGFRCLETLWMRQVQMRDKFRARSSRQQAASCVSYPMRFEASRLRDTGHEVDTLRCGQIRRGPAGPTPAWARQGPCHCRQNRPRGRQHGRGSGLHG